MLWSFKRWMKTSGVRLQIALMANLKDPPKRRLIDPQRPQRRPRPPRRLIDPPCKGDIMGKVACLSPFATLVCKEKQHFGFSSFPSSLFVGDLPVSSSPFFAFVLSASKDFNFGCSPLTAAVDAPGFFSVKASCSNSARRW